MHMLSCWAHAQSWETAEAAIAVLQILAENTGTVQLI